MSDKKMIIKNCPACYLCSNKYICDENNDKYCKDITDCVLKQIVESCKDKIRIYEHYDTAYALGKVKCAKSILRLLDIQEVE